MNFWLEGCVANKGGGYGSAQQQAPAEHLFQDWTSADDSIHSANSWTTAFEAERVLDRNRSPALSPPDGCSADFPSRLCADLLSPVSSLEHDDDLVFGMPVQPWPEDSHPGACVAVPQLPYGGSNLPCKAISACAALSAGFGTPAGAQTPCSAWTSEAAPLAPAPARPLSPLGFGWDPWAAALDHSFPPSPNQQASLLANHQHSSSRDSFDSSLTAQLTHLAPQRRAGRQPWLAHALHVGDECLEDSLDSLESMCGVGVLPECTVRGGRPAGLPADCFGVADLLRMQPSWAAPPVVSSGVPPPPAAGGPATATRVPATRPVPGRSGTIKAAHCTKAAQRRAIKRKVAKAALQAAGEAKAQLHGSRALKAVAGARSGLAGKLLHKGAKDSGVPESTAPNCLAGQAASRLQRKRIRKRTAASVADEADGRRRKGHNPWSFAETEALVEGVARCGGGRWADIKKLGNATIAARSAVDLKDKWRNLLRVALLPTPPPEAAAAAPAASAGDRKREVPRDLLERVRELVAREQARVGPAKAAAMHTTAGHRAAGRQRAHA